MECTVKCGKGHDDMKMKLVVIECEVRAMEDSRRGFIQFLARGDRPDISGLGRGQDTGRPLVSRGLARPLRRPGKNRWVMVIDLAKCDGCKDCTKACSKMHFVPPLQEWIKVYEVDR